MESNSIFVVWDIFQASLCSFPLLWYLDEQIWKPAWFLHCCQLGSSNTQTPTPHIITLLVQTSKYSPNKGETSPIASYFQTTFGASFILLRKSQYVILLFRPSGSYASLRVSASKWVLDGEGLISPSTVQPQSSLSCEQGVLGNDHHPRTFFSCFGSLHGSAASGMHTLWAAIGYHVLLDLLLPVCKHALWVVLLYARIAQLTTFLL